jgi:hypothetical protein
MRLGDDSVLNTAIRDNLDEVDRQFLDPSRIDELAGLQTFCHVFIFRNGT